MQFLHSPLEVKEFEREREAIVETTRGQEEGAAVGQVALWGAAGVGLLAGSRLRPVDIQKPKCCQDGPICIMEYRKDIT